MIKEPYAPEGTVRLDINFVMSPQEVLINHIEHQTSGSEHSHVWIKDNTDLKQLITVLLPALLFSILSRKITVPNTVNTTIEYCSTPVFTGKASLLVHECTVTDSDKDLDLDTTEIIINRINQRLFHITHLNVNDI